MTRKVPGSTVKPDPYVAAATQFVKIHNSAAKAYKAAFAEVGAKLWNADRAHALRPQHRDALAQNMRDLRGGYKPSIERPLTVLDSYKHVTRAQRAALDKKVNDIHSTHQAMVNQQVRWPKGSSRGGQFKRKR